jgi:hypothetical protein
MSAHYSGCDGFETARDFEEVAARENRGPTHSSAGCGLLRRLSLAMAVGLPIATAPGTPNAALVDWLVLLIDASESIDAQEYRLQPQAYVNVLQDPEIGLLLEGGSVAIVELRRRRRSWSPGPTTPDRRLGRTPAMPATSGGRARPA